MGKLPLPSPFKFRSSHLVIVQLKNQKMTTNKGIIDSACFAGKFEILSLINSYFKSIFLKLRRKIYFTGRSEILALNNSSLQVDLFKVEEHIEVSKLVKGRPLDNLEFMQWMKRYCDPINSRDMHNYNPLERRECRKGGREANKKSAPTQSSAKGSTAPKSQSSHNARKNDVSSANNANQAAKATKPSSSGSPAYDEQITELKSSIDDLEKERDFYFAKLRDIEILCQSPDIEHLPVAAAIKKLLYATDDDATVVAEARAMISVQQKEAEQLGPTIEVPEEKNSSENQKRKKAANPNFDVAGLKVLSPRQRLSDVADVHCSGSPLLTC